MPFTLRCIEWITSVLIDQQYMFVVRCLLIIKKELYVVDEKMTCYPVVSVTAATIHQSIFSYGLTEDTPRCEFG